MATKKTKKDKRGIIVDHFKEHVLLQGGNPASVFAFCKDIGIEEAEFYEYFGDFDQIVAEFWTELFAENIERLHGAEEWSEFSAREKLLSMYYSYFESLKMNRSYAKAILPESHANLGRTPVELKELQKAYKLWIKDIIAQGLRSEEIAQRSKLVELYDDLFWYQFLFILDYWRKDRSSGFESTDEAIEKAVALSFDLIEKNALESAFDFGKFLFQKR